MAYLLFYLKAETRTPEEVHVSTCLSMKEPKESSLRHVSLAILVFHAALAQSHTRPPALMHFYCPHPLLLHSSSLLPPAATTSLSSSAALPLVWHPHPSSALCTSILFHSSSLSWLPTSPPPHPSRPLTAKLAAVHIVLSAARSLLPIISFIFHSLSNKETDRFALLNLLKTNVGVRTRSCFRLCLRRVHHPLLASRVFCGDPVLLACSILTI